MCVSTKSFASLMRKIDFFFQKNEIFLRFLSAGSLQCCSRPVPSCNFLLPCSWLSAQSKMFFLSLVRFKLGIRYILAKLDAVCFSLVPFYLIKPQEKKRYFKHFSRCWFAIWFDIGINVCHFTLAVQLGGKSNVISFFFWICVNRFGGLIKWENHTVRSHIISSVNGVGFF